MSKRKTLNILRLYPAQMNLYGDNGNAEVLVRRAKLFDYDARITEYNSVADRTKLMSADIILGGGGQDSGQKEIAKDLIEIKYELRTMVREVPTLVICGLYQLFGHYFESKDGDHLDGIDVFDAYTIGGDTRMIGNIVESVEIDLVRPVESTIFGSTAIYGYENHSGETYLQGEQKPLGLVTYGYGNISEGEHGIRWEGAIANDGGCIGTYLHGPVLAKNDLLADYLLARAVQVKFGDKLKPLEPATAKELGQLHDVSKLASYAALKGAQEDNAERRPISLPVHPHWRANR